VSHSSSLDVDHASKQKRERNPIPDRPLSAAWFRTLASAAVITTLQPGHRKDIFTPELCNLCSWQLIIWRALQANSYCRGYTIAGGSILLS
jgi:hypothetical protein